MDCFIAMLGSVTIGLLAGVGAVDGMLPYGLPPEATLILGIIGGAAAGLPGCRP
jgi:hypothetical protein